jgi:hypothetical protein
MNRSVLARQMFARGGAAFPDLSGDSKITQKDILMGRGVPMQEGGDPQMAQLQAQADAMGISLQELIARLQNPDMANYIDESGELFYDPASGAGNRKQMFDEAAAIAAKYQQPVGMAMGGDPAMAQGVGSMMPPPPAMPEGQSMAEQVMDPQVLEGLLGQAQENLGNIDEAEDYETVINSIRGDDAPISARYEELAGVVGEEDAAQTPESVLTLVQPAIMMGGVDDGIGGLAQAEMTQPVEGAMAQGIMSTVAPPPPAAPMPPGGMGGPPPVNFKDGGLVRRGDNQPVQMMQAGGEAGATSRIKLSDKLNLATKTALSELGYAQKLGLQEAAAGQQMDLQAFLQDGRLSLAEYNATERKKLENVMQKNRADLATLRGSIDFNSRTDLQAQAADIAKQQAELQSELRINELGVGLENSKVLSDYRAGLTAEAAELDRSFREEQAALDREQKATGLDLSERQLALDEKYKLGKLAIDQKAAEEVKLGSEAKSAQLRFLTDPDRRRKYVTGELGDETALYEQALIEYAKPSFTWNGTSYVKSATPELAPALQQTIRDRKANGFETPKLPGVKIKATVEADPVAEAAFDSTEFKQSLIKDGAVNFDSPAWDRIPETVITSDINYQRATGPSEIPDRIGRSIAEFGRELGFSTGPTEDMSELTTAERDILNLKEEILQVINNMSDDRVLKATQDAIRKNAEPFTPGIFKFDESAAATLNGLKKQLGRAFAFYAEKDPLYNPNSEGLYDEDQVTKYRSKASGVRSVLKDVITLENAYRAYFESGSGSKTSRTKGRKASDGGVTAQDIISNLAKDKE